MQLTTNDMQFLAVEEAYLLFQPIGLIDKVLTADLGQLQCQKVGTLWWGDVGLAAISIIYRSRR